MKETLTIVAFGFCLALTAIGTGIFFAALAVGSGLLIQNVF